MAKKKTPSPPPDQKHRDRILSNLDCTVLVEAAAGSGKTTCLIGRMVALLREGKCRVETMAAVTFTRKAAAELRIRFQLAVQRAVREASGEEHARLAAALEHLERCFIGTIHSFCARLLRERPVEAGVDPGFLELDDETDSQLRHEAWREHVARLVGADAPIVPELERLGLKISPSTRRSSNVLSELDELGLEPAELGPAFLRFAEYLDVEDWPHQPRALPDLAPGIAALMGYAAHMRSLGLSPECYGNDKLMPRYELIARMVERLDLNQPAQLMEVLDQFSGLERTRVVQRNWPGQREQALKELHRWNRFVEDHSDPLLHAWREHRYEPVMRAIRPAREVYDRMRRERNGLNFQDLLLLSAALLRDNPAVRRYFRERFTHVLVDEFQDTDPIQAEVMLLLTADDPHETNWQDCRPVAGSLFVVGDPKQSIYRFRRADIVTYNKFRAIIERSGGEVIPLSANFRSVKPLVSWINGCFSSIFPATADDHNPADRPLDVGRSDAEAWSTPVIRRLGVPGDITRNDDVARCDADMIARAIRRALDQKLAVPRAPAERELGVPEYAQPGDFLIVARTKKRLTIYARALQRYGVPHSVTGGSILNDVPELNLLRTCLAAVVRPDDPIALVAALRSELFGIADTMLYEYRRLGGKFSYYADPPAGLPEEDAANLCDAFARLQTYASRLRRMPGADALEWIAADLGLIARACAAEEGDAHSGSLLKAIDLLRTAETLTAGDCLEALSRLVEKDEQHDGLPVRPHAQTPVRVMNLHQCKGLEAPFVFLVDPSGEGDHDVSEHIDRSGERSRGYLPIYGPRRSEYGKPALLAHPPGWAEIANEEQRFLDAEANRLLYVAATRAGVGLVVSQRNGRSNQKNPWRLFDAQLQEAASFEDPGPLATPPSPEIQFDAAEWDAEVAGIDQRWRIAGRPSYAVKAIKQSALPAGPKPHGAEKSGAEWGAVLHTLLETAVKKPGCDLHTVAISALEREELSVDLADEAVATVQRVTASEMWRRAMQSSYCLVEAPLGISLLAAERHEEVPTVFRGVIDLAFREPAGWVIVDYKSERVDRAAIPALASYYRPQLEAYARIWRKIVNEPVGECGLFFTHTGEYVTY